MKYMGSKRAMLSNGLGQLLLTEVKQARQFADLFVGSGAVAWYVAEHASIRVMATDLQQFAATLAEAVLGRTSPIDAESLWQAWFARAQRHAVRSPIWDDASCFEGVDWSAAPDSSVERARMLCAGIASSPIVQAYGGYYFSPLQALHIDSLRATLPSEGNLRPAALAALIRSAAECAASPGHTAQPFKPTATAAHYLFGLWKRSVFARTRKALLDLGPRHARTLGEASVMDASEGATCLEDGDVAFIDPPYSGVHYSRFYHVLETVARGICSPVTGHGRYPPQSERPVSDYSVPSKSRLALDDLLRRLSERGVKAILTFPLYETSNGLSGDIVEQVAAQYFSLSRTVVNGRFSTLGGNTRLREARHPAYELILVMRPK